MLNERQGEPLTHDWKVPGSEELKGHLGHVGNVLGDERRIIIGARARGPGNENHEWAQGETVLPIARTCRPRALAFGYYRPRSAGRGRSARGELEDHRMSRS